MFGPLRRRRRGGNKLHPFAGLIDPTQDYRGVPTCECVCGSHMFLAWVIFDEDTRLPGFYLLDGVCHKGHLNTLPTPQDYEGVITSEV